jgi:hypothetical protein
MTYYFWLGIEAEDMHYTWRTGVEKEQVPDG